jgi:hypothetical protein
MYNIYSTQSSVMGEQGQMHEVVWLWYLWWSYQVDNKYNVSPSHTIAKTEPGGM